MSDRRHEKRESRKKARKECVERLDQAKNDLDTLVTTLKDKMGRLTNACSNLENAVDEKREEVRLLKLVIEALLSQSDTVIARNILKEAAYITSRFGVARPAAPLTRVQTQALSGAFGDTQPNVNAVGADVLETRFLNQFPQFNPANGPPPHRRGRAPPADQTLASLIERSVGPLTNPAKDQLRDARLQYEAAITQALATSRGAAPRSEEVDQVAFGLVLYQQAFPNVRFGL